MTDRPLSASKESTVPDDDPRPIPIEEWRARLREWLTETLPPKRDTTSGWGHGTADFSVFRNLSDEQESALLEEIRAYRRARFDAGYGALTLPVEAGGAGLPHLYSVAFAQEEAAFEVPASTELISVTTGLIGPATALFGTGERHADLARSFLRTDLLACQLFSEPGAGSDLAALSCTAVRDGEEWVVDGQKVWTSGARFAQYGMLLARTDPDVPKQAGITAFLLPLDSDGVEIRPIRQMSGATTFNEVFLTGVRMSNALRLGEPGDGWRIATTTLGLERTSSGSGARRKGGTFGEVLDLARALDRTGDPVVRQRLADLYIRTTLHAATNERVARAAAAGQKAGAAGSLSKLTASANLSLIAEVAADLLGARLGADTGEWGTFAWGEHLLGAPGYHLAGGTDEIQRTIIGERVLGLPAEPRVDRNVPFSQLGRA
jgi:alkylation response protein AidB-like acyl-CoA dehydrogenase